MTLRQTFNQLKQENNKEKLNYFYMKYGHLMNVPAKTLTQEIVDTLKKNNEHLKIYPVYEIEGNLYELQSKSETEQLNQTIATSISIKDKYTTRKISLTKGSSAKSFEEFEFGDYTVNVFDILLNDNIESSKEIHLACWKAVATNLREQFKSSNDENTL